VVFSSVLSTSAPGTVWKTAATEGSSMLKATRLLSSGLRLSPAPRQTTVSSVPSLVAQSSSALKLLSWSVVGIRDGVDRDKFVI
jgi:hypothetical protein